MVTQAPDNTVKLTINGQPVVAPKGMLLVEAAKLIDLEIPVFCYEPRLKSVGACRMCLVQIEKLPRLQTACTTPVAADMVVHTNTPEAVTAQNGVLELLLANHPLDCPICDKGGECPLQDNTFKYGPGASRFTEEKRHKEKAFPLGERIVLDRERCIMCYRCVRFHQEIPGDEALAAIDRGADSEIATLSGEPYDSMFSGNTIELCPVGALTSRQYRFKARPWDLVRTPSVCNGCAVGCNIEVHSRAESVLRIVSRANVSIDDGWLCDRGRFDTLPRPHDQRPARPMLRQAGMLRTATWDEALVKAAELLGQSGGVLASAGLSNEAFWLLQRVVPRLPAALWPPAGRSWPVQGQIQNLARCKAIVLVGLDVWNDLPILALWVRKAVVAGAKLVVLGPRNGLARDSAQWLKDEPLAGVELLLDALESSASGNHSGDPAAAAAAALRGRQPVAVLAHPSLAESSLSLLERLVQVLGATGENGMLGAPLLGANGAGATLLAPGVVDGDVNRVIASSALLALGDEPWFELQTGSFARIVLASSQPVPDDPRIDVVLPMTHAYERQASLINLDGRLQHQEGGAAPPAHARPDWTILSGIAQQLDIPRAPASLDIVRANIADEFPSLRDALFPEALFARV